MADKIFWRVWMVMLLTVSFLLKFTQGEVGDTMVLDACSYINRQDDQDNAYIGTHGFVCCMCRKGTKLVDDCQSADLPYTTRCDPCEHNAEIKTYIDYEPHKAEECENDFGSCVYPFVYIEGSPSRKSKCECGDGYESKYMLSHKICKKLPNISTTVPTSINPVDKTKSFQELNFSTEASDFPTTTSFVPKSSNENKTGEYDEGDLNFVTDDMRTHRENLVNSTAFPKTSSTIQSSTKLHKLDWIFIGVGIGIIGILLVLLAYKQKKKLHNWLSRCFSNNKSEESDPEKISLTNFMVPDPANANSQSSHNSSGFTTNDENEATEEDQFLSQDDESNGSTAEQASNEVPEEDQLLSQNDQPDGSTSEPNTNDETDKDTLHSQNGHTRDSESEQTGFKMENEKKPLLQKDEKPRSVHGTSKEPSNVPANKAGPIFTDDDKKPDGRVEKVGDDTSKCSDTQKHDNSASCAPGVSALEEPQDDRSIQENEERIDENASPKNEVAPIFIGENNPHGVLRVLSEPTSDTRPNESQVHFQPPSDTGQGLAVHFRSAGQESQPTTPPRPTGSSNLRLTDLHKQKRREAAKAISRVIVKRDCLLMGHLLIENDEELDGLMTRFTGDPEETAWQIFRRSFQTTPNLSLYNLRDFANDRGLGYLKEIIQDKINALEQEENSNVDA